MIMEEPIKCQACIIAIMNAFLYNIDKDQLDQSRDKIISNFADIEKICKNNKEQILEILFLNKEKVKEILYDNDKNIDFEGLNIKPELPELFYLSLLLDNPNIVYFKYSIGFIRNLDNSIKKKKYINKIILSKIIIKLIDNFEGLDYYYQDKNELEEIKKRNIKIIKSNLEIFNKEFNLKYDINHFLNETIDLIYKEIISSLFKKAEFNNCIYYKDIIEQINLESINNSKILNKFFLDELDINKNKFLEEYKINANSYEGQKEINFYEILIKVILKKPLDFYHKNDFLKNNLIQLSNFYTQIYNKISKNEKIANIFKENYKKLKILKTNTDFENLYIPEDLDKNSNPNNYNQNISVSYFQGERNENDISQSKIETENKIEANKAKEILNKVKIKIEISYILNNIEIKKSFKYGNNYQNHENTDEFLFRNYNYDDIKETDKEKKIYIKYKQFLDFLDEIEEYIIKSEIYFNPKTIILDLKKKELNSKDFDMNCIYSFESQPHVNEEYKINNESLNKTKLIFQDNNILTRGINGKNIGFALLINELKEIDNEGVEYSIIDDF